jgi:hypothetical protein
MTDTNTPVDHLARAKAELAKADDPNYHSDDQAFSREVAHVHALVAIAEALQPRPAPSKDHKQILRAAQKWAALPVARRSDVLFELRRQANRAQNTRAQSADTLLHGPALEAAINLLVAAQNGSAPR